MMPISAEAARYVGAEGGCHGREMLFAAPAAQPRGQEAGAGMRQETPVPARPQ